MPSSFSQNLGIELPADGELDGLWGDVVNTNMNILDRAINGTVTLTLTGTTSTLTTSDGVLSNGQYRTLLLSGSPSGTHTITISPNDAQKMYLVKNNTAQSVVFTQGSGGNATIAAGGSAIIYSNGGGSVAAVGNIADSLSMSSVRITGGSITGITDLAVADGGTGASDAATARTNLGLGSVSTQNSNSVSITGGSITGITDLAIADGGTGASSASSARANLGVAIGTDVQAYDADLTALAALASNGLLVRTGSGTAATRTITGSGIVSITNGDGVSGNPTVSVSSITTSDIAPATLVTSSETISSNNNNSTIPTCAAVDAHIPAKLNASGSPPIYAARAWGVVNGSGTFLAGGNISATSGTNPCSVTFAVAMPDANYVVNVSSFGDGGNTRYPTITSKSAGGFTMVNGVTLNGGMWFSVFK